MPRQVITQSDIQHAISEGLTEIAISQDAIVTSIAAEMAQGRQIKLRRTGEVTQAAETPQLGRTQVRAAVVAALGETPSGLDDALDRVLGR